MKVLFDFGLKEGVKDGIGTYGANLVTALKQVSSQFSYQMHPTQAWNSRLGWPPFGLRKVLYLGWNNLVFPGILKKEQAQLVHGLNMIIPLNLPKTCKSILTIYDFGFIRFPETFPPHISCYYKLIIPQMVRKADHILTISAFTKRELVSILNTPEEKITVTPLGSKIDVARSLFRDDAYSSKQVELLGIKGTYILAVGTLEPRKNLSRLIKAFDSVSNELGDISLVIAGAKGWLTKGIDESVKIVNNDKITFLGSVSDEDLQALYAQALFFVYPSLYEGFGLPVLEAMSMGTPVITSNCSSLPEVAGDAAILVDPFDIDELAQSLLLLAFDTDKREVMRQLGFKQAAKFSWEKTAHLTIKAYKKLLD